jgi:hypothetical protein
MVNKEYLAVLEKHDKLISSLRTAQANEYSLDKEQTSYDDFVRCIKVKPKRLSNRIIKNNVNIKTVQ